MAFVIYGTFNFALGAFLQKIGLLDAVAHWFVKAPTLWPL